MTVLPARSLGLNAYTGCREVARYECVRAESRWVAGARKFDSEAQILDDVPCREPCPADAVPRESHSCSHQLTGQAQPTQAGGANMVLDRPGKLRDFHSGTCARGALIKYSA